MTTLVVCVDRTNDVGRKTGVTLPVAGWEAVRSLVTDVGLADPEDSSVNTLLEALRVARDLRDDDEPSVVAVVAGDDSAVSADRAIARQLDDLIAEYDPDSAVVVIDSAEDERLVPIVESRLAVDSVDRVVVRQARDLESTYYLLKQFLADEELRQTVLVPIGVVFVVAPVLSMLAGPAVAFATITAVLGVFLLYKGLSVDDYLGGLATHAQDAIYSGQVSVVTYVVAAGLTLIGAFAGAYDVSTLPETEGVFVPTMQFVHASVPWLTTAAVTATSGRVLDEALKRDGVPTSFLNLPFGAVALGIVIRGFSSYFLERAGVIQPLGVPAVDVGVVTVEAFSLSAGERLTAFIVAGVLVSAVGMRVSMRLSGTSIDEDVRQERPES